MAKITRHGGPTLDGVHERVLLPAVTTVVPLKEDAWPGSSSETTPVKPPKSDEPTKPNPLKRARTTGARSRNTKGSGTAQTGTTSGPVTDA